MKLTAENIRQIEALLNECETGKHRDIAERLGVAPNMVSHFRSVLRKLGVLVPDYNRVIIHGEEAREFLAWKAERNSRSAADNLL